MQTNKQSGSTLVELILYIAISTTILTVILTFLSMLLQARVKNQTIAEVEQQGLQIMQLITQTIRNADSITSPTIGNSAASLTLDNGGAATTFDLTTGAIRIIEGAAQPVALSNSQIIASGLNFNNLSRTGTPGIIRVQFTLTHINQTGRNEYNYNKTFYDSASLR